VNAETLVSHLGLSVDAFADRRIPKSTLSERAGTNTKERRLIKEGVESLRWIAVLKPGTVGIRKYADEQTDYTELSVLKLTIREPKGSGQLQEMVHHAIPYHALLLTESGSFCSASVARKRRSKSEKDRFVLEDQVLRAELTTGENDGFEDEFAASLSLESVSPQTLRDLYLSWADSIVSLEAARITGHFRLSSSRAKAEARSSALREYLSSHRETERIRKTAKRETQAGRRVELNLALQELKRSQERAVRTLNPPETHTS